jgi:hypothetical protein
MRPVLADRSLKWWVRIALMLVAAGLIAVFAVANKLSPYGLDGKPLQSGTHQQLGLPPCTFRVWTGKPCPACGLTTSFALLVQGDLEASWNANAIGTLLAIFCLALAPWNLACALRGRLFFVRSIERSLTLLLLIFLVLLLLHWGVVLCRGS